MIVAAVFFGVFALVGAIALWQSWRWRRLSHGMLQWRTVTGKMLTSKVRTGTVQVDGSFGSTEARLEFYPDVEYEYEYGGQRYRGRKLILTAASFAQDKLEQTLAGYPVGSQVVVWVNPKRPDMAILERNTDEDRSQFKLSAILGTICLLIGLGGLMGMYLISRS